MVVIGLQAGCSSDSVAPSGSPMDATAGDDVAAEDANSGDDVAVIHVADAEAGAMPVPEAGNDEASAPWVPSALSGLVLWLDDARGLGLADAGVDGGDAGPPLLWIDQSGHGNNASGMGSPAISPAALHGKPAVHFNGTTDYLLVSDSPTLQWGTGDFVVALVVQHTTFANDAGSVYGTLYSKQIADVSPYGGVGLFANTPSRTSAILAQLSTAAATTSGSAGYNNGSPFVVVMHRSIDAPDAGSPVDAGGDAALDAASDASVPAVASLGILIDGLSAGTNSGAAYARDVSAVGYAARIGGTQYGQDMTGDIAEVIGIQGAVSDDDLAKLEAYLKTKYGL